VIAFVRDADQPIGGTERRDDLGRRGQEGDDAGAQRGAYPGSRVQITIAPQAPGPLANRPGMVAEPGYSSTASTLYGVKSRADARSSGIPSTQYCGGQSPPRLKRTSCWPRDDVTRTLG
jgi:hypothetical protein